MGMSWNIGINSYHAIFYTLPSVRSFSFSSFNREPKLEHRRFLNTIGFSDTKRTSPVRLGSLFLKHISP